MPKIKTVKSASKRIVKVTKNGLLMRLEMSSQHLVRRKSKRTRQKSKDMTTISGVDAKKIKRLIPYR